MDINSVKNWWNEVCIITKLTPDEAALLVQTVDNLIAEVERLTGDLQKAKIVRDPCWSFQSDELVMLNIFEREEWYQNTIDALRAELAGARPLVG